MQDCYRRVYAVDLGPITHQSHLAKVEPGGRPLAGLWRLLGRNSWAWREEGLLAVSVEDDRLTWPERELVEQLGTKLYGKRGKKEVRHGR